MEDVLETRVRQVLAALAPTQGEAARRVDIEATKLSKSLNGVRRFTAAELSRIAQAGGVSVEWLVHGRGSAPRAATAAVSTVPSDDARRQRYLEEAWKLISTKGFHAVRVADIAAACGTSSAAVHYYFPGKQDVLQAAMERCVEQAFARQNATLTGEDDAYRRMLTLIELQTPASADVRLEWSVWMQFWSESVVRPELRPLHHQFYAKWRTSVERIVRRGQSQGVFRTVDVRDVALRFTSLTDGLGIQVMTRAPDVTPDTMRQVLVDFVRRELLLDDDPDDRPGPDARDG